MRALLLHLAQWLLKRALDRALEQGLPQVFGRIDRELPLLLEAKAPPTQVSGLIASAIADATGHRASAEQVQAVIGLYNPVAAAANHLEG
jgi:hypothetical protein